MVATFYARLGLSVHLAASMLATPTQEHNFHNLIHVGLLRLGFLAGLRGLIFVHWSPAVFSIPKKFLLSLQCGAFSRDVILDLNY